MQAAPKAILNRSKIRLRSQPQCGRISGVQDLSVAIFFAQPHMLMPRGDAPCCRNAGLTRLASKGK